MTDNLAENVEDMEVARPILFTYDGTQMNIAGDFLQADFYTASGTLVASLKEGQTSFVLPAGLYVVRALLPSGAMDVQKLLIR